MLFGESYTVGESTLTMQLVLGWRNVSSCLWYSVHLAFSKMTEATAGVVLLVPRTEKSDGSLANR